MESEKDWKLKLRYGKLITPYKHYTLIAEGVVGKLADGFECRPGTAFMAMKAWASSEDEAFDMIKSIGRHIGFSVTKEIQLFNSDPQEPPSDGPYGYEINFHSFDE
jgi:hypothetical protein